MCMVSYTNITKHYKQHPPKNQVIGHVAAVSDPIKLVVDTITPKMSLTLTVLVTTIDALQHFETG